ncbi:CHAP domain-containing protein, partial [Micromonospora noduli]|uniref:CHAP domain-containing protein n=1 Tax=Micromonospora noduli TaxID=709876 RepID=UPI0034206CDC
MFFTNKSRRIWLVAVTFGVTALSPVVATSAAHAAPSRDSIVSVARSELANSSRNVEIPMGSGCNFYSGYWVSGYNECGRAGFRKNAWCADFARYVWKVGGVTDLKGLSPWAYSFWRYGLSRGTWHAANSGYTPQPGDAVVFDWNPPFNPKVYEDIDHVGIVESYSGGKLTTIEGNTSDATHRRDRTSSLRNGEVVGFTSPIAGSGGGVVEPPREHVSDISGDGHADLVATKPDGTLWYYANNMDSNPGG